MRSSLIVALAALGGFGFPPLAGAETFSYQALDVPGAYMTTVSGINDFGQAVGTYSNVVDGQYGGGAFLESNGVFTTLPIYNPSAINDAGQILSLSGGIVDAAGVFTPIIVPPGTFPNPPGYTLSVYFTDINNAGQIVGAFTSLHLEGEGTGGNFLYSNGVFTILQAPAGFTLLSVAGINNSGQIFGTLRDGAGNISGFIDDGGVFTTFQLPPGISGFNAVNDSGELAVSSYSSGGYAISAGEVIPLEFPGASYTIVSGINNEGQIVGTYADYSQSVYQHGFIATPLATPEPASLLLVGVGLGLVAAWRHKRCT